MIGAARGEVKSGLFRERDCFRRRAMCGESCGAVREDSEDGGEGEGDGIFRGGSERRFCGF